MTEVVGVSWRGGRRWVYLDAGIYSGLVETLGEAIRYRLTTDRDDDERGPVVLAGPTCDSVDVLYERTPVQLPISLREGDRVVFGSAGAYTSSYSTVGFNGFAPLPTVLTMTSDLFGGSRGSPPGGQLPACGCSSPMRWRHRPCRCPGPPCSPRCGRRQAVTPGSARPALRGCCRTWCCPPPPDVLADRVSRTRVLRWSTGIRAVLLAGCAAALATDQLGPALVLAVLTVAVGHAGLSRRCRGAARI